MLKTGIQACTHIHTNTSSMLSWLIFDVSRLTKRLPPIKGLQINSCEKTDAQKVAYVLSACLFEIKVCYELVVYVSAFDLNVPHDALSSFFWFFYGGICFKTRPPCLAQCLLLVVDYTPHRIRRRYWTDHKQIAMPFSPIFDDAVLPQAFVSSLGHSCQTRCYPRSPPKKPQATRRCTPNTK